VIVRIMGEGQYEVDDGLQSRLNEIDDEVGAAFAAGDQAAMSEALRRLAEEVRGAGRRLDDTECPQWRHAATGRPSSSGGIATAWSTRSSTSSAVRCSASAR